MWPVAFQIFDVPVPSYFLTLSLACCVAVLWSARRADAFGLSRNIAIDTCLLIFFTGMMGARAFHVAFEYPALYLEQPQRIFFFWEGGFVFYGGAISAYLASVLFLRSRRQDLKAWMDFAAPIAAGTYALGRLGCFLAGCCYGQACTLPWAVTFPPGSEAPVGFPIHPTQLYATVWESLVLGFLLLLERRAPKLLAKPGDLFWIWLMLHGLGRVIMEYFRADFRGPPQFGLSVSTWISLILIVLAAILYIREDSHKTAKKES